LDIIHSFNIQLNDLIFFQTNGAHVDGVTLVGSGLRRVANANGGRVSVRTCQRTSTERVKTATTVTLHQLQQQQHQNHLPPLQQQQQQQQQEQQQQQQPLQEQQQQLLQNKTCPENTFV
jgi:hypothetical protein